MPETPGPTRLFALRWTDRSSRFFDALKAPYVQPCRKRTPPNNPDKTLGLELPYATPAYTSAKIKTDKAGVPTSSLNQSIPFYGPTSRWRWVDGLPLVHIDDIPVTRDCEFTIEITTSKIGGREIRHLSKTWSTSKEQGTFSSEVHLTDHS
ncbi:hypothetical protein BD779DRAFT_18032 [Infundibulicybe gibba]|nr:hypothetical protein BD779DRAFT_18032 [Infundibulicybe gibba]